MPARTVETAEKPCKYETSRIGRQEGRPTQHRIDGVVCKTPQLRPESQSQQVEELRRELRRRKLPAGCQLSEPLRPGRRETLDVPWCSLELRRYVRCFLFPLWSSLLCRCLWRNDANEAVRLHYRRLMVGLLQGPSRKHETEMPPNTADQSAVNEGGVSA